MQVQEQFAHVLKGFEKGKKVSHVKIYGPALAFVATFFVAYIQTESITTQEQHILHALAFEAAQSNDIAVASELKKLSHRMGVASYKDIPRYRFGAAVDYLDSLLDDAGPQ